MISRHLTRVGHPALAVGPRERNDPGPWFCGQAKRKEPAPSAQAPEGSQPPDRPVSTANHRLGRPAAAGPPLWVSPPSPAAETADPRTGRPAPRRRARWSAYRRAHVRRTLAAHGEVGGGRPVLSSSELPRLPGQGHCLQVGGSALGGPLVEQIRNCVGQGHVGEA